MQLHAAAATLAQPPRRLSHTSRSAAALGVTLAVALFLAACGGDKAADKAVDKGVNKAESKAENKPAEPAAPVKPALTVTLVSPAEQTVRVELAASGSLAPWQELSVSASVQGLRLTELNAQVGDVVKKGKVLARFDSAGLAAEIAASRAQVAEAEAAAAEARSNGARARELQKTGFYSEQALNQWLAAEKSANARLDAAKAGLQVQTIRLQNATLTAPDAGSISARPGVQGSVVAAGQELYRIIRQGRLEWRAELTDADAARVKKGDAVRLDLSASAAAGSAGTAKTVAGRVRQVAPALDAQTRNALVYVDLDPTQAAAAGLKSAQFVRGAVLGGERRTTVLPASALVLKDGFSYVFAVDAANKVTQTKITTGARVGLNVEVLGLPANAKVVAMGAAFLSQGDTVKVVSQ